jgi:two-component system response regulator HydG
MVKVSCAALPETLLEAELFGYEKGAFTGANSRKEGRFELAAGGTLFLDEIGEITPGVQVKLLRVLQDGKFERLGGTRTIDADVRIITATNKDLNLEVAEKRFREDLFYRLNVINIRIPALRERKDDIHLLAMHFLKLYSDKNQKQIDGFTEDAMLSVLPQNVSAFAESRHSLTFKIGTPLKELERKAIEITLQHARGDKNMAARLLGIATRTIYRHLEREGQEDINAGTEKESESASAMNS